VNSDSAGDAIRRPQTDNLVSGFIQDEVSLIEGVLAVTAGVKLERNDYTGLEAQPTVRLAWTPTAKQTLWTAVSRAVRTPARFEHQINVPLGSQGSVMGMPAFGLLENFSTFRSESLRNVELGYRVQASATFAVDLATFYNNYSGLRSLHVNSPRFIGSQNGPALLIPLSFSNGTAGRGYGTELAVSWRPADKLSVHGSYSWLKLGLKTDPSDQAESAGGASPQHQANTRVSYTLPLKFRWDTTAYYVGALKSLSIPGYLRLDSRLTRPIGRSLEFSVNLQNALDPRHLEFKSEGNTIAMEIPRTLHFGLNWRY
jgi:iron complex outermembrane receptor protein